MRENKKVVTKDMLPTESIALINHNSTIFLPHYLTSYISILKNQPRQDINTNIAFLLILNLMKHLDHFKLLLFLVGMSRKISNYLILIRTNHVNTVNQAKKKWGHGLHIDELMRPFAFKGYGGWQENFRTLPPFIIYFCFGPPSFIIYFSRYHPFLT